MEHSKPEVTVLPADKGEAVMNNSISDTIQSLSDNSRKIVRLRGGMDIPFLVIVITLLCLGTVMIFSASYAYAAEYFNDAYYFLKKQLLFVAVGLVVMLFAAGFIDYKLVKRFAYIIFIGALVLMIATAVPGIGTVHHGARRWLEIGPVSFQPSEIMKLAVVIFFARFFTDLQAKKRKIHFKKKDVFLRELLPPVIIIGVVSVTLVIQGHLSGLIIIAALSCAMMFICGYPIWALGLLGASGAGAIALYLIKGSGFRSERITVWLDPTSDALGKGWQTLQSLYAISQGGLFGSGIGESRQKNLYLPEPQNDFIFSIWCEELGFIGAMLVVVLFVLFVYRGIKIAMKAHDQFASYMVIGIVIKVAMQALLNIAVVTNTIPNTGISLPFFSYGGTSLIFLMLEMGLILSVSRYSYLEKG